MRYRHEVYLGLHIQARERPNQVRKEDEAARQNPDEERSAVRQVAGNRPGKLCDAGPDRRLIKQDAMF